MGSYGERHGGRGGAVWAAIGLAAALGFVSSRAVAAEPPVAPAAPPELDALTDPSAGAGTDRPVGAPGEAASAAVRGPARTRPADAIETGLACDGGPEDAERLRRALAASGGGTVWIPSRCRIVVPSPGRGGVAFELPGGTRIVCADATAGFALARRACAGGPLTGAHCRVDADCAGGECREDLPGRSPFAPGVCAGDESRACVAAADCAGGACVAPEEPYTLFAAARGAARVEILGCAIDVRQTSRDEASGALYGTCNGGAADGRACRQLCTAAPGGVEVACNRDSDCGVFQFGTCSGLELCGGHPDGGGDCFENARQPGAPAGPGRIRAIDFSAATYALVADVWVWDHVYGDFSIALGTNGRLVSSGVGLARSAGPSGAVLGKTAVAGRPSYRRQDQHLDATVVTGVQGTVAASIVRGGAVAVRAGPAAIVNGNNLTCADGGGLSYRFCGEDRRRPHDQRRTCASDADCAEGCVVDGPDCIGILVDGDQVSIVGNRIAATFTGLASTPRGLNTTFTANRVMYGQGPKIAVAGSGWSITDNYLAWGTRPQNGPIVRIGPSAPAAAGRSFSDHVQLSGNLLFGDGGDEFAGLVHIGLAGGRPGAHQRLVIAGNTLLMKPTHVGIDFATMAPAKLGRAVVSGNTFFGGAVGIAFPADASLVSRVTVSANAFTETREPLRGFDWRMGDAVGNSPALGEAPQLVRLRSGAATPLRVGDALVVVAGERPEDEGRVQPAPPGSRHVIGFALDASPPGGDVRVAVGGTARCRVAVGWLEPSVTAGTPLAPGSSEAGTLEPVVHDAPAVAIALATPSEDGEVRCLVTRP